MCYSYNNIKSKVCFFFFLCIHINFAGLIVTIQFKTTYTKMYEYTLEIVDDRLLRIVQYLWINLKRHELTTCMQPASDVGYFEI